MNDIILKLLSELEQFGLENDRAIKDRPHRMLNITRDTGEFLSVLALATNAQRILEIGTSNGYSTIWLANAARAIGGQVTTVESSEFKLNLASENFNRAHLSSIITQIHDDAEHMLTKAGDEKFDLIFLDSERSEYPSWWAHIKRVLRKGGLLVVDNAISHREEMAPFISIVQKDLDFTTCLVPVGNGEFLATRSAT